MEIPEDTCEVPASVINPVVLALDADIAVYAGAIYPDFDDEFISAVTTNKRRKNILLVLTTYGGLPDASYRIARCLQHHYKDGKFILFVDSVCKSAGTLIALGADEIIMSEGAEFGPLDMQLLNRDEVGEMTSGLTPTQALGSLKTEAFKSFDEFFRKLRFRSDYQFSTKMASAISARLVIGLFQPVYAQLDPARLAENQRAITIASEYGDRLATKNVLNGTAERLIVGYPSHGFVIDRHEAQKLFAHVRTPSAAERQLSESLQGIAEDGMEKARLKKARIEWISSEHPQLPPDNESIKHGATANGDANRPTGTGAEAIGGGGVKASGTDGERIFEDKRQPGDQGGQITPGIPMPGNPLSVPKAS